MGHELQPKGRRREERTFLNAYVWLLVPLTLVRLVRVLSLF